MPTAAGGEILGSEMVPPDIYHDSVAHLCWRENVDS